MEPETLRTVLIGTSLDSESDAVVRAGIELARLHGATSYLAHAYDRPPTHLGSTPEPLGSDTGWAAACQALEAQAARVGFPGSTADGRLLLRPGAPRRVLQELAADLSADLVVLGHRHGFPLGPTLDRALRCFDCPVLVVHATAPVPPVPVPRVLAAIDLSPASLRVLRRGLQIVCPQAAAPPSVEVLHVLSPAGGERGAERGLERSESLAREARPCCLPSAKVTTGDPDREIVAEAAAWNAGVVLVGTHARTRLDRFLLGSVARGVLRWAPCTVLVIPPAVRSGREPEATEAPRVVAREAAAA